MTQETKEWYERAVMDFEAAKHLAETYYPKPIEIAGFSIIIRISRNENNL